MPDGQDKYCVVLSLVPVQRKIARLAPGNDQFPQPVLHRAPHERVIFQYADSLGDEIHGFQRGDGFCLQEKIGKPFKISERARRVDYARQGLAFGFGAALPLARARTYACTSSAT